MAFDPAPPAAPAPAGADTLALDRQLCFALYSASLAMTRLQKPRLEALGLTYPQYLVLLALWAQDGQTVGELGARLVLDSGTLTPMLKRMEAAGWLHRERDPADERRVRVELRPAGRALREPACGLRPAIAAAALAAEAPPSSLDSLTADLLALRDRLLRAAEAAAPLSPDPALPAGPSTPR